MKRNWTAAVGAALILASFVTPMAHTSIAWADSISGVEGARAKLRTGSPLTPRDRAMLRRYGTGTGREIPSGRVHRPTPSGGY